MGSKILGAVCLLLFPGTLHAEPISASGAPVTARLDWSRSAGAEECIDAPELAHAVNRRWGREVIRGEGPADLTLQGSIGPRGDGTWVAHLEMRRIDGSTLGSREIATQARDCSALDDSIALAAGLMLDMSSQQIEEERTAAAQRVALPASPPNPHVLAGPSIQIPKETQPARAPWRLEPMLGGEVQLFLLPGAAVGARAGVGVDPPRFWRFEAAATLFAPMDRSDHGRGAHFTAWSVDLGICPVEAQKARLVWRGCIVQRLGLVRARGTGYGEDRSTEETLFAVGLKGALSWRFARRLELHVGLRGEVPLARYRFVYEDSRAMVRSVYEMGIVSTGVDVAVGAPF